jgi:hypothetical protein
MSTQTIQSFTLRDAVISQVQELINGGTPFSRYEVTKALRNRVNNGELEIPELATGGSNIKFWIKKDDVDNIFEDIFRNPSNYGVPPLRYSIQPGQAFRTFEVDSNASQFPSPAPVSASLPAGASVTLAVSPVVTSSASLNDAEIRRRIKRYLERCLATGELTTLKKIQSAIKRGKKSTGLSYNEIRNVAASLGYAEGMHYLAS